MKDEWAHEKSLEVFRKQAQGTFTIKDPIAPIEEALLEVERETEKRCADIVDRQIKELEIHGSETGGMEELVTARTLILKNIILELSPSERNEGVKRK